MVAESVKITVRNEVSINTLRRIASQVPVVRTPHVGNFSMYNLVVAKYGFPAVCVDANLPSRDFTYNPTFLIKNGRSVSLTSEQKLTSDVFVTHLMTSNASCGYAVGTSVSQIHMGQLCRAFPQTNFETYSEFFVRHASIVERVFEVATDHRPSVWYRKAGEDGKLTTMIEKGQSSGIQGWKCIANDVLLPPRTSGWVVPNILAILLDMVVQSNEGDCSDVWMLSGPDFVGYIAELGPSLSRLYTHVAGKLNLRPNIQIHIVPFASFRLAVRRTHAEYLDEAIRILWGGQSDIRDCGPIARQCVDLWAQTNTRKYLTQHDVVSPDCIYVPEQLLDMPLWAANALWNRMKDTL